MKKLFLAAVMMMGLSTVSFAQSNFSSDVDDIELSDQNGTVSFETQCRYDRYTHIINDYIQKKGANYVTNHLQRLLDTYNETNDTHFMKRAISFYERYKNAMTDRSKMSWNDELRNEHMGAEMTNDALAINYALTGNTFIAAR